MWFSNNSIDYKNMSLLQYCHVRGGGRKTCQVSEVPGSTAGPLDCGGSRFRGSRFRDGAVRLWRFQGSKVPGSTSQGVTRGVLTSVQVPARFQVPGSWGGAES